MTRKRHWHPPGYKVPRARCGAWIGTARLTQQHARVTCARCRQLATFENQPQKGTP